MALPIAQKEFLVAFYSSLLLKNKFCFVCYYPNSDKSLLQVRKDLFKHKIFIEVLATKVFSRNFFPLAGPHFMILINNLIDLSLIPTKYLEGCRLVVTYNTVYPYSLFLEAQQFNKNNPQPYKFYFKSANSLSNICNFQLMIIRNIILRLNHAHC
jgi:hypothetical protein